MLILKKKTSQPQSTEKRHSNTVRYLFVFICFLCLGFFSKLSGQGLPVTPLSLCIKPSQRAVIEEVIPFKFRQWQNDSIIRISNPVQFLSDCRARGYLAAAIDMDTLQDTVIVANFFSGPFIHWVFLQPADASAARWWESAGTGSAFRPGQALQPDLLVRRQQKILEQAENKGYPFARIWLDSIQVDSLGGAGGRLNVLPGRYFEFNVLKINGEVKIPANVLSRYLGIRKGDPFSRARVLDIRKQMKALPYLDQYASPTINFAGDKATVNLWLKKKRAGRFDFLIGLLPQPATGTEAGKLLLTGSLNALLLNALGQGERLSFEMERLRPETQKLNVQTSIPYIAGSPFGAEGKLLIYRRDSSWVDAQGSIGVQYLLAGNNRISFFGENRSSSLQKVDTLRLLSTRRLPIDLDFKQTGLGMEIDFSDLDDRFNPRKGWSCQTKVVVGKHQIRRNTLIEQLKVANEPGFQFSSLYDSLDLQQVRIRLEGRGEVFVPVSGLVTTLVRLRAGGIQGGLGGNNEQYRLGGSKLLRGFDEESLFATRWVVATAEVRLLLGQNSYMAVLGDYGYVENSTTVARIIQHPLGLGAGMNFETQAGVFGISAAVGRGNPGEGLGFKATKIHVGYVSVF